MTIELAIGIAATVVILAFFVLMFIYKRNTLKSWLLTAVEQSETELGAKRGQEKLELVHKGLIEKFPVVGRILPFALFSKMVDEALKLMEYHLNTKEEE